MRRIWNSLFSLLYFVTFSTAVIPRRSLYPYNGSKFWGVRSLFFIFVGKEVKIPTGPKVSYSCFSVLYMYQAQKSHWGLRVKSPLPSRAASFSWDTFLLAGLLYLSHISIPRGCSVDMFKRWARWCFGQFPAFQWEVKDEGSNPSGLEEGLLGLHC